MPSVYILECADGSYYVGSTNSLEHRLFQHQQGTGPTHTRRRRPVQLVWAAEYTSVRDAYFVEHQLKGWSRAKKRALIEGRVSDLPVLSSRSALGRQARAQD